ncbi:MAG: serine protease [Clostridiales bacterium]|jgi:hypothetical protein|nr:serine protease [Clostridiales bacterium]
MKFNAKQFIIGAVAGAVFAAVPSAAQATGGIPSARYSAADVAGGHAKAPLTPGEIEKKCAPAVFHIEMCDRNGYAFAAGSGSFISKSGLAVTCLHAVEGAYIERVMTSDGKWYGVKGVYGVDKEHDLALIQVDGGGIDFPYLETGDSEGLPAGRTVYTIGYPDGAYSFSAGVITGVTDGGFIQSTATVGQGSSGGALVNEYGELIGVTPIKHAEGSLARPISLIEALGRGKLLTFAELMRSIRSPRYADYFTAPDFGKIMGLPSKKEGTYEGYAETYFWHYALSGRNGADGYWQAAGGYIDALSEQGFRLVSESMNTKFYRNSDGLYVGLCNQAHSDDLNSDTTIFTSKDEKFAADYVKTYGVPSGEGGDYTANTSYYGNYTAVPDFGKVMAIELVDRGYWTDYDETYFWHYSLPDWENLDAYWTAADKYFEILLQRGFALADENGRAKFYKNKDGVFVGIWHEILGGDSNTTIMASKDKDFADYYLLYTAMPDFGKVMGVNLFGTMGFSAGTHARLYLLPDCRSVGRFWDAAGKYLAALDSYGYTPVGENKTKKFYKNSQGIYAGVCYDPDEGFNRNATIIFTKDGDFVANSLKTE